AVALQPANLLWCLVGVVLGTVVGILPGLGPPATIAMLLPLTFLMNPAGAMIMLAGIYYGAKYGGSTTSILLNVPGESASVVTCLDGYQMARQGRAGAALGIAAIASFIAGTVGVLGLMLVAPPLAKVALSFSSPEYFALMALGLAMVVLLAGRSMVKALLAMLAGLWIAGIGTDLFSTTSRFTIRHRHGSVQHHLALHVRAHGAALRGRLRRRRHRRVRDRGGTRQHGGARRNAAAAGPQGPAQSAADDAGPQGLPVRVRQRIGGRLPDRRAAGGRFDDRLVHLLRPRKGGFTPPRAVRHGGRRRRGRTRRRE